MSLPACPECKENMTYEMGNLLVCPMCGHEWTQEEQAAAEEAEIVRDVNGNELQTGDDVVVAVDLKVGKDNLKQGTKVKNITLLDVPVNDHDISAKVEGFGNMYLKSSVVKK